ncbi:hypothetical protein [Paenibacillus thalictri]|uniref:Uncharacterized protein n=1 Tax=Paenibacillus thalictri TaxID=2527873 RepID=A0A4Q9DM46_9BACL|nr:hypothetical protein [Paenibacillus thalictri]TBL76292.1 hypothetical protein EYB31_20050 [Paenibacillus thalictri]
MNQRISADHLQQLSDTQKETLRSLWNPQEGEYILFNEYQEEMIYYLNGVEKHKSLPLLTIGQMISYLTHHDKMFSMQFESGEWQVTLSKSVMQNPELCNALWEATMSKL